MFSQIRKLARLQHLCAAAQRSRYLFGSLCLLSWCACDRVSVRSRRDAPLGTASATREVAPSLDVKDPQLPAAHSGTAAAPRGRPGDGASGSPGDQAAIGVPEGPKALALPHYFPETATPQNLRPLLLFLHGYGASGALSFNVLGLAELGRKYRIFIVAPDGSTDSVGRKFWNAHPACCNFEAEKRDHVRYLSTLVDEMTASYPVDPAKIYVIGFSNGAFMAHRLGCEWGSRLSGIVSVAGAGPDPAQPCKTPTRLRVLEMHGDADPTVSYGGGTLFGRAGVTYASALETLAGWGKRLDCAGAPIAGVAFDLDPRLPGDETSTLTYSRCARGSATLWTVHGGSHLFANRPSVMEKAWLFLSSNGP